MTWLLLALLSAITSSLTRILQKVLLKDREINPFAFNFVFQILISFLFLLYIIFTKSLAFPSLSGLVINLILMAVFYGLGNVLTFKALKLAEASEVSVIFASNILWSVISAMFILGEKLTPLKIFGVILVLFGLIAINHTRSQWKINKGHLFALLGAMLFGVAFINDIYIVQKFSNVASFTMLAQALSGFTSILFNPKAIKSVPYFIKGKIFTRLFICSLFSALSVFTIYQAYKMGGSASIISPILGSSFVFTVIIGYIFLKEKDRLWNKVLGSILTLGGVLLLV